MPKAEIQVKVLSRPVADSGLLRGCRAISHRITHTSERNLLFAGGVAGGTGREGRKKVEIWGKNDEPHGDRGSRRLNLAGGTR